MQGYVIPQYKCFIKAMFPDCSKQLGFSRNNSHIKKYHYTALKMTSSIQSSSFNFLSFLLLFSSRFPLVKKNRM